MQEHLNDLRAGGRPMTAKEMFEELGFEYYEEDDMCFCYLKTYPQEDDREFVVGIYFYRNNKTFSSEYEINMQVLKAINKQMEELECNNE